MQSSVYLNENLIVKMTFDFSLSIIDLAEQLTKDRKFVLSDQILRSGTSIGANTREAQNAESKADFIHKFKIAAKEAEECEYWLLLAEYSPHYPSTFTHTEKLKEIKKVINKIIVTSKMNK